MRVWPLVFSYRGIINGGGFSAMVDAVSRVLAEEQETGDIWMNGADPGGIAIGGDGFDSAHEALKHMFWCILTDAAEEAGTFDGFRAELQRFFGDTDRSVNEKWIEAWEANRRGQLDCEPLQLMERATGQANAAWFSVEQINIPDELATATGTEAPEQVRTTDQQQRLAIPGGNRHRLGIAA